MTDHFEVTKVLRKRDLIHYCINCRKIQIRPGKFVEYEVPEQYKHKISAAVCDDCFDEYRLAKISLKDPEELGVL